MEWENIVYEYCPPFGGGGGGGWGGGGAGCSSTGQFYQGTSPGPEILVLV